MRKFSKKILIVSFLLTSVLIPLMESRGYVWTAPEPITDTISIQEDGEIDVFIDKTGKIHVAYVSTYYDVDTGLPLLDNELNYLNNYNMNDQETGFPLIEESALLCVNNEEDIYNITSIAKPSVSSDSESLAMVGFEGVLVETGTKEAWVSMIKNDSLSPEVLPLSHRNSTYSTSISEGINFKYIRNYGSDFIAVADNPTDPKIVTFSSINPQKNLTLNQLLYLDYPKHAEYNGSMLMVASGKNFLTFNVSNLDNIGANDFFNLNLASS